MNLFKYSHLFLVFCFMIAIGNDSISVGYWSSSDLFKAGDAIQITMFPDSTIMPNGVYPVDEDGFIDLPRLGMVKVAGMNEKEFIDICKKAFSGHLRYLDFRVRPLIRISCLGGFESPGLYWVSPKSSLWEVIKIAGGTIRGDGIGKIKLEREGDVLSRDLGKIFQNGKSLTSQGIVSGDQITISNKEKKSGGEVITQIVLPILASTLSIAMTSITIMSLQ